MSRRCALVIFLPTCRGNFLAYVNRGTFPPPRAEIPCWRDPSIVPVWSVMGRRIISAQDHVDVARQTVPHSE